MSKQRFEQLNPHLWVTQSDIYATNSGIFISEDEACLIDPGMTPKQCAGIAHFVAAQETRPRVILITHGHWDHLLGVEHFPGVDVVMQAAYLDVLCTHGVHLEKQVADWVQRSKIRRQKPWTVPQPSVTFEKEYRLTVGAHTLRLVHMPGHASDQCIIYHPATGTLWAGDMLSDLEIPFVSHSLGAYMRSLTHLMMLDLRALVPGHGAPTTNRKEIHARVGDDLAYLSELHARVESAITQGKTIEQTVALCQDMPFRRPEENAGSHRLNVESAYLEMGGKADPRKVGWNQEWTSGV